MTGEALQRAALGRRAGAVRMGPRRTEPGEIVSLLPLGDRLPATRSGAMVQTPSSEAVHLAGFGSVATLFGPMLLRPRTEG